MRSFLHTLAVLGLVLASVSAQGVQTVYFSTRFTETPTSGRAGDNLSVTPPCGGPNTPGPIGNYAVESALANSPGISYVEPGVPNVNVPFSGTLGQPVTTTDYVELVNFPQMNLIIGDLNANGVPDEPDNFRGVDAIYIPSATVGRHNNVHEMFISTFQDSAGSAGFLGAAITEADMVMLPRAPNVYPAPSVSAPPVFFVRQADWEAFFGLAVPNSAIDVDGFAVDQSNGDIYVSFDTSVANGLVKLLATSTTTTYTIAPGDIIRIPGTAYTPSGPFGIVTLPLSGQAQLVFTQNDVANAVFAAGGGAVSGASANVYSLDLDPNGGTGASPATLFTFPNLLFTVNRSGGATTTAQLTTATAIFSTVGGGAFAVINGVIMSNPVAAGLRNVSWNTGFWAGPLDALDVVQHTPALDPFNDKPLHMDSFPTSGLLSSNASSWTGVLTCHVTNAAPSALLAVFAAVYFVPPGSFAPRYDVSPYVGGYTDLYVDVFGLANPSCLLSPPVFPFTFGCQVPIVQTLISANPVPVWVDPVNQSQNGDVCFTLNLSSVVPVGAPPFAPPPLVVFQCLDTSYLRLSNPLAFQLN